MYLQFNNVFSARIIHVMTTKWLKHVFHILDDILLHAVRATWPRRTSHCGGIAAAVKQLCRASHLPNSRWRLASLARQRSVSLAESRSRTSVSSRSRLSRSTSRCSASLCNNEQLRHKQRITHLQWRLLQNEFMVWRLSFKRSSHKYHYRW